MINQSAQKMFSRQKISEWYSVFYRVKEYIDENKCIPNTNSNDPRVVEMGNWIYHQFNHYNNTSDVMKNTAIKTLWMEFMNTPKYKTYILKPVETWLSKFYQLKTYISKHKKLPSTISKDLDISSLGMWYRLQVSLYKKDWDEFKLDNIRKIWDDFTSEYSPYILTQWEIEKKYQQAKWFGTLRQVKKHIDKHGKSPQKSSYDIKERGLYNWISYQKQIDNTNHNIMQNMKVRKEWEKFMNEYSHKI